MPYGLQKFFASLAPRPESYEQLCRVLWEREIDTSPHASKPSSMPLWYHDTSPTKHVNEDNLPHWWWAAVIGIAANAVRQLMHSVNARKNKPTFAYLVKGLSFKYYKKIKQIPVPGSGPCGPCRSMHEGRNSSCAREYGHWPADNCSWCKYWRPLALAEC